MQSPLRNTALLKLIVVTFVMIVISVIFDGDYVSGQVVALEVSVYTGMVCMVVYYFSYYLRVQIVNKYVHFFADISYEIYLTHAIYLGFSRYIENPVLYGMFVVFTTILTSVFVRKLRNKKR